MVIAMNNPRLHCVCVCLAFTIVLAGCFGGKPAVTRSESQQRAESSLIRGVRAEQKGAYPEAEKLLKEALTISSSIEDSTVRITSLINLARLHRLQHELPKSELFIDQALVLLKPDSLLSAEAFHEKALLEITKGNPSKALKWAQQAIASEPGNKRGSRRNLASRIHLALGNWSVADSLARAALVENRSAGHAEEEGNSLRIMGIVARNEKKYTEGERFLLEALSIDKRLGRSVKIAADLEELAKTSQNSGKIQESADYLERAFDVNLAAGRSQQAQDNQAALAEIYVMLGDPFKTEKARETARKLAVQDGYHQPPGSSETINPSSRP